MNKKDRAEMPLMDTALLKALAHPTRQAILLTMVTPRCQECGGTFSEPEVMEVDGMICQAKFHKTDRPVLRPWSPNLLATAMDEPLGNVSYHVKTLLEYDTLELVKTEPRRGAVEHFYLPTGNFRVQLAALASVGPEVGLNEEVAAHA
jgi:hypothetical protein